MTDFRRSWRGRRQRWFGLKRPIKRLLSAPVVHPVLRGATRVAPGLARGRLPAPSSVHEVEGVAAGARFVLLRPDRCEIAKELYWGHGRRPVPQDSFALDLVVTLARRADVLLDVGAYTGVFTVAAAVANPRLHVEAFEIVPSVVEALRANVDRNGLTDRVTVHASGLGDPGLTMRVPIGEGGSALPSFYSAGMEFDDGVEVGFTALDAVAADLGERDRVVMKVDVEGAEAAVLGNGQGFLDRYRPDILCEVLHGVGDGPALERLLAPRGLRYYLVRPDALEPRAHITPDPHHRDWLFSPRTAEDLRALGVPVV